MTLDDAGTYSSVYGQGGQAVSTRQYAGLYRGGLTFEFDEITQYPSVLTAKKGGFLVKNCQIWVLTAQKKEFQRKILNKNTIFYKKFS